MKLHNARSPGRWVLLAGVLAGAAFGQTVPTSPATSAHQSDEVPANLALRNAPFDCAIFSADGKWVLTGATGHTLESNKGTPALTLWDSETGRLVRTLEWEGGKKAGASPDEDSEGIQAAVFSPDGKQIASGGTTGIVRIWDVQSGRELRHWEGGAKAVSFVQFSFAGKRVLTHVMPEKAKVWEVATGKLLATFGDDETHGASFDSANEHIVTWRPADVTIWNADSGESETCMTLPENTVFHSAEFSPDGTKLTTACSDNLQRVWDVRNGTQISRGGGGYNRGDYVGHSHFSPDGKWVFTSGLNTSADTWDVRTGAGRFKLSTGGIVTEALFNADQSRAVLVRGPATFTPQNIKPATGWAIYLWNLQNGRPIKNLSIDGAPESSALGLFSPDGKRLLVHLNKTEMWDSETGNPIEWKRE